MGSTSDLLPSYGYVPIGIMPHFQRVVRPVKDWGESVMIPTERFLVLDPEYSRRARLAHGIANKGWVVEPFANPLELKGHWPKIATVLVADSDAAVKGLFSATRAAGRLYPVIAYSERPEPTQIVDAVLEGALDYLEWPFTLGTLVARLPILQSRYSAIGAARLRELKAKEKIARLTPREHQVLSGLVDGHSNRGIAAQLNISPRTVEIHRANMMRKVGAHNVAEAVKIIYDQGGDAGEQQAA